MIVLSDGRSFDDVAQPISILASKKVTTLSLGIGKSRQLGAKTLLEIAHGVKVRVGGRGKASRGQSELGVMVRRGYG